MEKIIVNPLEVRGLGNIVSPKTLEDFEVYNSSLSFEDSVYTLAYDASVVSVGLSVSSGTISVGGSVVLTAEVLSAGEPAVGETVSFYDGTTLLGTDETDSDGIATYTASSLSVGSHSLTAEALDKSSSAVTVTVNKLTSTITISVPSTGTVGTSYTVSGTLVPTSGSVKLYENSVLKDTLTVSSGSFSKSITQSNEGTYSYYAVFEGSSTYSSVTSSTGSIVVSDVPPVPVVTSVSLTGDKSILSYADSESAVLSATVLDQSSQPMENVTVEFFKGSTSLGTATTNSSGVATKTYSSAGVGDVSFTASVGTISSETYSISDIYWYSNDGTKCSGTYSTGTDGDYHYITNIENDLLLPAIPTGDFELSMKAYRPTTTSGRALLLEVGTSKSDTLLCGWDTGTSSTVKNVRIYRRSGSSNTSVQNNTNPDYNNGEWIDFKLRFENGTVTLTIGGTSVSTSRSSVSRIGNYDSSTSSLSEMQIRTL